MVGSTLSETIHAAHRLFAVAAVTMLAGCSPGLVGTRAFTAESRRLVWQDTAHCMPFFVDFSVKCTDCAGGWTYWLGSGDFAIDETGRYVLIFPAIGANNKATLVRLEDRARRRIDPVPGEDCLTPGSGIVELAVETLSPPRFRCCLVHIREKKATLYEYNDAGWHVLESGEASEQRLAAAKALSSQTAFIDDQVTTRTKKTSSPDGRYVLVERTPPYRHHADLKETNGKRSVRLATQTDQLFEVLRHFGEWLVFGRHANGP